MGKQHALSFHSFVSGGCFPSLWMKEGHDVSHRGREMILPGFRQRRTRLITSEQSVMSWAHDDS